MAGSCNVDDSLCMVNDFCVNGVCVKGQVVLCFDDANFCMLDVCNSGTGECSSSAEVMDGEFCDLDGDLCIFEVCKGGVCYVNDYVFCLGDDPCKDLYCDFMEGCKFYVSIVFCDDEDYCINDDNCVDLKCVFGSMVVCDDGDLCMIDICYLNSWCKFKFVGGECSILVFEWIVLVYMAVDNNFESAAFKDIEEMVDAKMIDVVSLIV